MCVCKAHVGSGVQSGERKEENFLLFNAMYDRIARDSLVSRDK